MFFVNQVYYKCHTCFIFVIVQMRYNCRHQDTFFLFFMKKMSVTYTFVNKATSFRDAGAREYLGKRAQLQ